MDSYNFRNVDKSIVPTSTSIDKVLNKSPNVLRMVFSTTDRISGSLRTKPHFAIQSNMFQKFDSQRPIYFYIENMFQAAAPNYIYYMTWENGPFSPNHCWISFSGYRKILGIFQTNPSNTWEPRNHAPYMINSVNDLISNGTWEFALYSLSSGQMPESALTNDYIFSLVFFQT